MTGAAASIHIFENPFLNCYLSRMLGREIQPRLPADDSGAHEAE